MDKITELVERLKEYSAVYYNTGEAKVSDARYDGLVEELRSLDPNNPFFQTVGAPSIGDTFKHEIPVGSQEKLKDREEFDRWCKTIKLANLAKFPYCLQWKLDGNTIVAYYKDGKLIRVLSRGDGISGSDLTANAVKMQDVFKVVGRMVDGKFVGFTGSVRGEAILPISAFDAYFKGYKNPRNAVSGLLRDLKGNDLLKHAKVIYYDIFPNNGSSTEFKTEEDRLALMQAYGIPIVNTQYFETAEEVWQRYQDFEAERSSLEVETDGLILRANDLRVQTNLGMSSDMRPHGQKCIKWKAQGAITKLLEIDWTIGHTGAMIPTAVLEPVEIGGVTVSHVLLNNVDYMKELGLTLGCSIEIERRGDVIPHLERVIEKTNTPIPIPTKCIACGSKLVKDGVHMMCKNEDCDGKEFQRLKNWVTKRNIKYLGDECLLELYENHGIHKPADLYKLTEEFLSGVNRGAGIVGSGAKPIIAEIQKSKICTLSDLFGSIGAKFLGRRQMEIIIEVSGGKINTVDKFLNLTKEQLLALPGFKETKAAAIIEGIQKAKPVIQDLLEAGVKITKEEKVENTQTGNLAGRIICFTGVRPKPDEQDKFIALGGVVKDSVSKNLTHLVVKDLKSSSSKAKKALSLGVELVSYEQFQKWLEG